MYTDNPLKMWKNHSAHVAANNERILHSSVQPGDLDKEATFLRFLVESSSGSQVELRTKLVDGGRTELLTVDTTVSRAVYTVTTK